MAAEDLGSWDPLSVADVVARFHDSPMRWWIGGGWALALHLGRTWRAHGDTDVGIVRDEAPTLRDVLPGWDVCVAASGVLSSWDGRPLVGARNENNLWCRPDPGAPWAIDVIVGEGDATAWIYRRDQRLRLPWPDAVRHTTAGVPYLAPELQLLFKSAGQRPKDDVDAAVVIPVLTDVERARLAAWLPAEHDWHALLAADA